MTAVQIHGQRVKKMNISNISQIEGNFDLKGKTKP